MAVPKSTNERIRRKLRSKKMGPSLGRPEQRHNVKKTGNNDPDRNHSKLSEEFLQWYKGIEIKDPQRFTCALDKLLMINEELGRNVMVSPFSTYRLLAMREIV